MKFKIDRSNALYLAIMSGLFFAIYKGVDNYVVKHVAQSPDKFITSCAYLVVGAVIGAVTGLILQKLFGRKIVDENYKGLIFRNKTMWNAAVWSGILTSFGVLIALFTAIDSDPSVLVAIGSSSLLYTMMYEVFRKHVSFKMIAFPALLVFLGSLIAAYNPKWSIAFSLIVLVFFAGSVIGTAGTLIEQVGVRASNGVSIQVWRFVALAFFGPIVAFAIAAIRGQTLLLVQTIYNILPSWYLVVVVMVLVFFRSSFQYKAQEARSVSEIQVLTSPQIIMAFAVTFGANFISPGIFGEIPTDPAIWIARAVGSVLIVLGVGRLKWYKDRLKPTPNPV